MSQEIRREAEAEERLDRVFDSAFRANDAPMLDYARLKFELKGLRQEREALARRVPEWQPIETVPRDGTRVVVWTERGQLSTDVFNKYSQPRARFWMLPAPPDAGGQTLECDQCGAKPDTWGPEWAGWTATHGESSHCPMDKIQGCDGLMRRVQAGDDAGGPQ